ncbi:MAG: pyrroline-5-carboxylate reductase [Geobacteraceae bacterium]
MLHDIKIGFIGGGNMAEALIKGLLAGGTQAAKISVAEPDPERRAVLRERYRVAVEIDNRKVAAANDVLVLAIKPQVAPSALEDICNVIPPAATIISIMAGITTAAIEALISGDPRVVRVMPNTPALVLESASALCAGIHAKAEDLSLVRRIFALVGKVCVVEERLMDAVTGLSGSGPAYVLTFIEALSDAGVKNGLSREVATSLAVQTVYGTSRLLLETDEYPAILREKVTSPGGTTIAGLHALEQGGFRGTVINAVDAATARSKELGN